MCFIATWREGLLCGQCRRKKAVLIDELFNYGCNWLWVLLPDPKMESHHSRLKSYEKFPKSLHSYKKILLITRRPRRSSIVQNWLQSNCSVAASSARCFKRWGRLGWNSRILSFSDVIQRNLAVKCICYCLTLVPNLTQKSSRITKISITRCSAIAERPRCRVRYSFRQK